MNRRDFLKVSGAGVAAASLAAAGVACGGEDGSSTSSSSSTESDDFTLADSQVLQLRFPQDVLALDPARLFGVEQETLALNVYSGLAYYDPVTHEIKPDAAEKWEWSDDLKTWTFALKKGIEWQKGYGELTSADVAYSYRRVIDPATGAAYRQEFANIDAIETPNPYTVVIKLKTPDVNFLHQVINYHQGSILSQKAVTELGDKHWFEPVGTGPFIFKDFKPATSFVLEPHVAYFGGKPTLDRIEARIIVDGNTGVVVLQNNEVDVSQSLNGEPFVDTVNKDPNLRLASNKETTTFLWLFNPKTASTTDIRVRQAMMHAIDFDTVFKAVAPLTAQASYNLLPTWMPEYSSAVPRYPYDKAKAKSLLSQAGMPNGFTVKFLNLNAPREEIVLMQSQLAEVGIKLDIEVADRAQFNQRRSVGNFELGSRALPAGSVDQILFPYLHPSYTIPSGYNMGYDKPQVTQLLASARSEPDEKKRMGLYHDIQTIALTDLPYMPTQSSNGYWGMSKWVHGIQINRLTQASYFPIKLEKKG